MQRPRELSTLLDAHRVVVCAGAGGVGKTTVSASLALAAALRGKNVLCLTIDPARRLASSFGLEEFPREEMRIAPQFFETSGLSVAGGLTVMMLDPRATFDELIYRFARTKKDAERVVSRPVYAHLAENLAGTQAYMAMEKVLSVLKDDRFDLVLLDTPPSARALDFFDAPMKMGEIIDSPATRALIRALRGGSRTFQLNLLGVGLRAALRGLERITGGNLLFEIADLLSSMNELLGGFEQRAKEVGRSLRSPDFGYVLVTAPHGRTISDAIELARAMRARELSVGGLVINRTAQALKFDWEQPDVRERARGEMSEQGLSTELSDKMLSLARMESGQARVEKQFVAPLLEALGGQVPAVYLPTFGYDVYRLERIAELAQHLVP